MFFDLVRQINRQTHGTKHIKQNQTHDHDQVKSHDDHSYDTPPAYHENRTNGHAKDCCVLL